MVPFILSDAVKLKLGESTVKKRTPERRDAQSTGGYTCHSIYPRDLLPWGLRSEAYALNQCTVLHISAVQSGKS